MPPGVSNPVGAVDVRPASRERQVSQRHRGPGGDAGDELHDTLPAGGALTYQWRSRRRPAPRRRRCSKPASATRSRHRRSRSAPPPPAPGPGPRRPRAGQHRRRGRRPGGVGQRPPGGARARRSFAVTVPLALGVNTLTARAVNDGGNAATASIAVIRLRAACVVPRLRGSTLRTARRRLARGDCRTGRVVRVHSTHVRRGRVVSSLPRAGGSHRPGTRVRLIVSLGR